MILSDIGIGTFVDPRQQGGKLNEVTKEDLIKLVEIDNKEYLYYKAIAPTVAFIRATTCDSEGYASFEDEVMYLDALVLAQAVHNHGGIVMMQVQKMVKKATLHPKSVRIPGYLVDIVVVDPDQTQLYGGAPVNRFISGDFTLDDSTQLSLPSTSANWLPAVLCMRCVKAQWATSASALRMALGWWPEKKAVRMTLC